MTIFRDVLKFADDSATPPISRNGTVIAKVGFRVARGMINGFPSGRDISGRPGIGIEVTDNGASVNTGDRITGEIPAGFVVNIGNASHVLREPVSFAGGDIEMAGEIFTLGSFGANRRRVQYTGEADTRARLRRAGAAEWWPGFQINYPGATKGYTDGYLNRGLITWLGFWYTDAFTIATVEAVGLTAPDLNTKTTVQTTGTVIPRTNTPLNSHVTDTYESSDARIRPEVGGVPFLATSGLTLPAGTGIAVFDDTLTQNWADQTPVTFAGDVKVPRWSQFQSEGISERVVETDQTAALQTLSLGKWLLRSQGTPTGQRFEDDLGRVWTVVGYEYAGRNEWLMEAMRDIE